MIRVFEWMCQISAAENEPCKVCLLSAYRSLLLSLLQIPQVVDATDQRDLGGANDEKKEWSEETVCSARPYIPVDAAHFLQATKDTSE